MAEKEVPDDDDEFEEGWLTHTLVDNEYDKFKTQGIDPKLDPNTLRLEDPRNPITARRREEDAQDAKRHVNLK